jgi:hypothetical protein
VRSTEVRATKLTTQQESAALPQLQEHSTMPFSFDMVALKETVELFRRKVAGNTDKAFYQINL